MLSLMSLGSVCDNSLIVLYLSLIYLSVCAVL